MSLDPRSDVPRSAEDGRAPLLSAAQAVVALWLVASPFVLEGPSALVAAKDLAVGAAVLAVSLAGLVGTSARRLQAGVCAVAGLVLVVASVVLEFGPGSEAVGRQWSEVVAGVVLVCLAAARTR